MKLLIVLLVGALLCHVHGFSITELPYVRQKGFQDVVFRNSRVGTTEFLVLTASHGNPDRGIIKFPSQIQGGGWKLAVYGGDDDKSAEIYHRIVTNGNKDDLGQIDSVDAAASLTMVVFEDELKPGNTGGAIIENQSVKLKVQGTGQFLFVFGSDNRGTSDIADFSIKLNTDDPSFFFLVNNGDFSDPSLGNRRGAISGIQLLPVVDTPPPTTAPPTTPQPVVPDSLFVASSDSEEGELGNILLGSSDLELTFDTRGTQGNQVVGVQFEVDVPKGAEITAASIQFECDEENLGASPNLFIAVENSDNSPDFTSSERDITSRSKAAEVRWNNLETCTVGKLINTPNLKTLVEAIVSKPGWEAGNTMTFIIRKDGTDINTRTFGSIEGGKPAKLIVELDISGGLNDTNHATTILNSSSLIMLSLLLLLLI